MHVHLLRVFALSVHYPVRVLDGHSTVNTQINQCVLRVVGQVPIHAPSTLPR